MQTGKLLDVDIHTDFRTLVEHKAFWSTWCKTFLHTREKALKISLAPTLQEGPFQVMSVGGQQQKKQNKLNTRERQGQDATKKKVCSRTVMHAMPLVSNADFDDSTDWDGEKNPIETLSRISQRRSMKQDVSDSTISFTF